MSAILPVNTALLPAGPDTAGNPPAGGVPFPDLATAGAAEANAYYQAVTARLNAAPASHFTPDLTALDAMIQSLRVAAP